MWKLIFNRLLEEARSVWICWTLEKRCETGSPRSMLLCKHFHSSHETWESLRSMEEDFEKESKLLSKTLKYFDGSCSFGYLIGILILFCQGSHEAKKALVTSAMLFCGPPQSAVTHGFALTVSCCDCCSLPRCTFLV